MFSFRDGTRNSAIVLLVCSIAGELRWDNPAQALIYRRRVAY
jgi:hypothetical protein